MRILRTEITIQAPVACVWEILTDFPKYPEWNPFIKFFEGDISEGSRFKVSIQPPGRKPMTFRPVCLQLEKPRAFRWLGHLWIKGLFDGEHRFELSDDGADGVRFIQSEQFKGILVPLLWNQLETPTRNGFEAMNSALKERAEG